MQEYKEGHYNPLGADGGVLKYISCTIDDKNVHASITLDSEIQKIRAVWCLEVDGVEVYDFINQYYQLRK